MNKDLIYLQEWSEALGVSFISSRVLNDIRFQKWSGSEYRDGKKRHHYGEYGLVQHTAEVVRLCMNMTQVYPKLDKTILFLAALFHDIGKTYDYIPREDGWKATDHKKLFHHITRSVLIWEETATKAGLSKIKDAVTHAILAHHGLREWGSPVAPQTPEAWVLHLCDSMSARLDECYYDR